MSFNVPSNSSPNWQENASQISPVFQPVPPNSPCAIYPYTHPSSQIAPSPQNQFALHPNQFPSVPDHFVSNNQPFPAMIKNFPKNLVTPPSRYRQCPVAVNQQQNSSPVQGAMGQQLSRQQSFDENNNNNNQAFASAGSGSVRVKGIQIDSAFYDLQRFGYDGCTFAETVAQCYRKRPCFKKIDLLLSRLKNDLNVYHNILSNVNSQGTAWAIKDFIFAYSRIINAWVILRGYVYDQTEGLDTLRCEFDPDYIESFAEWQSATLRMMKSLMRTVENLNTSAQFKSGSGDGQRKESVFKTEEKNVYSKEFLETFQKTLFTPRCVPNSEEIQIRNHHSRAYFRAGVLKPLMIDNSRSGFAQPQTSPASAMNSATTPSPSTGDSLEFFNWWSPSDVNDSPLMMSATSSASERLYNRGRSTSLPTTPNETANPFDFSSGTRAKKTLLEQFNSVNISD